ncbi:MAG TPA: c-type cytochrome [Candidatus Acidoferrales bacterium]|nr:c-type cytochrome [Candidatus Acidoferrales bacterium]
MKPPRGLLAFVLCAAAISLAAWGCAHHDEKWPVPEAVKKIKNPIPLTEAGLNVARGLYLDNCAQCHGEKGKGDGIEAAMYSVKPVDLTDPRVMSEMTDGELFYKITQGRRPMPSFKGVFNEEKRWQLVHLLRTFAKSHARR